MNKVWAIHWVLPWVVYAGHVLCWAGYSPGGPWGVLDMGYSGHEQSFHGIFMRCSGHGLKWACARLEMSWSVHRLGWTSSGPDMIWAGHGLDFPWSVLP